MIYVVNVSLLWKSWMPAGDAKLRTQPEHLHLQVGDSVIWRCHLDPDAHELSHSQAGVRFDIDFRGRSPFRESDFTAVILRRKRTMSVRGGKASEEGDYKYDVRAVLSGQLALEEDPYLHVAP